MANDSDKLVDTVQGESLSVMTTSKLSYDQLVRTLPQDNPRIVVVEGRQLGRIFELDRKPITIGRDPRNTLCLDEAGVSRTHAVIMRQSQGVIVRDVGSKNGTFVNRNAIDEHVLQDGDIIQLGSSTLKYLSKENLEHSYYEYLHQASVEDAVTKIPNRRYFEEYLFREIARSRRYERPLSLLMIDLDHFKRVNDTYGHLCGDHVLREFAAVVSARLRRSEFVARYGGEEFALTLPETELPGAQIVAESIRLMVEKHGFSWEGQTFPVTISIGGATLGPNMTTVAELVQAADIELYRAKHEGRNRVCLQGM